MLWFCGIDAANSQAFSTITRKTKSFDVGGYYIIRGKNSFGMVRCTKYKHRPGHADMLHFDLWYNGINVLTDIGSYSYNPEPKFKGYFNATKNHNTITINNQNQTKKGPRFLTIDWPEGYVTRFEADDNRIVFSGYHNAFKNLHKRMIEYRGDCYIITDVIDNRERNKINIKLNWNIGTEIEKISDNKCRLIINDKESLIMEITSSTKGSLSIYYGDKDKLAGWKSPYYGEMIPVNQLVYEVDSTKTNEELCTFIYYTNKK